MSNTNNQSNNQTPTNPELEALVSKFGSSVDSISSQAKTNARQEQEQSAMIAEEKAKAKMRLAEEEKRRTRESKKDWYGGLMLFIGAVVALAQLATIAYTWGLFPAYATVFYALPVPHGSLTLEIVLIVLGVTGIILVHRSDRLLGWANDFTDYLSFGIMAISIGGLVWAVLGFLGVVLIL